MYSATSRSGTKRPYRFTRRFHFTASALPNRLLYLVAQSSRGSEMGRWNKRHVFERVPRSEAGSKQTRVVLP